MAARKLRRTKAEKERQSQESWVLRAAIEHRQRGSSLKTIRLARGGGSKRSPSSLAKEGGLQPGDMILELDRHPLLSASQFVSAMHGAPSGKDILLLVWSKGNASYRTVQPKAAQKRLDPKH